MAAPSTTSTTTDDNKNKNYIRIPYKCKVCHIDWKSHGMQCQLFTIQSNNQYGRYLVATRDIQPGEVIMNEEPIVVGPRQDSLPICLGCYKLIKKKYTTITYTCTKCKLPLCGPACEKIPCHADNECRVFSENGTSFEPILDYTQPAKVYECLLILRCLMLKANNPRKWNQLTAMTCQNEARKRSSPGLWERNHMNNVRTLMGKFDKEFSELDIHTVVGYIDINAFGVSVNKDGYNFSGLFDNTFLMAHDCAANTQHTFTEDMRMVVRACVRIPKGEKITTFYVPALYPTAQRSLELLETKLFLCKCRRCLDPTELGTYFTAIRCQCCWDEAYSIPVDPTNQNTSWKCQECGRMLEGDKVRQLIEPISLEIKAAVEEEVASPFVEYEVVKRLEIVMQKYSTLILHPNHYLMVKILHYLVTFYGSAPGLNVHELSLDKLKHMKEICEQLLGICDRIRPGMSRLRGFTLHRLQSALLRIAQRESKARIIRDNSVLKERYARVKSLLGESQQILNFDGPNTTEGAMAATIPESMEYVNLLINLCNDPE